MAPPSTDLVKLTEVFDRACRDSGFRNYMPERMVGHFVRQVLPSSLKGDSLDMTPFYQWVRQEYSVPDHIFARVFSRLKDELAEFGLKLVLPASYEPGMDETVRDWIKGELKEVVYEDLKEELRGQVRAELKKELRPDVFRELREELEQLDDPDEMIMKSLAQGGASLSPAAAEDPELREELLAKLRPEVERELQETLIPLLTEEVRERLELELRPRVAMELKSALREQVESELREQVEAGLREELLPRLHGQVAAEVRAMEHGQVSAALREQCSDSVRDELRRELWDEVREEVKDDLRELLKPVLVAELREEMKEAGDAKHPKSLVELLEPGEAPAPDDPEFYLSRGTEAWTEDEQPAPPPPRGLRAEEQLTLIRRIREELTPALRAKWSADLTAMLELEEKRLARERLKARLQDPEYCLTRLRAFLFPEQPSLWDKVRPLIQPEKWRPIVLALEDESGLDHKELDRARSLFREALRIKAEIDEEMAAPARLHQAPRGKAQIKSIHQALSGAEEILDYALSSATRLFEEMIPPSFQEFLES